MSAIIDIGPILPGPLPIRPNVGAAGVTCDTARTSGGDTVELSSVGRTMARSVAASRFRMAWLASIRAEIDGGTYETPERISGTVDRLLDVLA